MKNLKLFFAFVAITLLVISCAKENLTPETEDSTTNADARLTNELSSTDYFQLDEGMLFEEADILAALNVEPEAESRSSNNPIIYTIGNETRRNEVIVFTSNNRGRIKEAGRFRTGGRGTGDGLGNQGALALNGGRQLLYVVNPGSNEISFFITFSNGKLFLIDKINSGGVRPVSITVHGGLIYVLNAGSDNIAGFTHNRKGKLVAIPNSKKNLSGKETAAAQISFSPNGRALVVAERATNLITSYPVQSNGRPGSRRTFKAANNTPFGFEFGRGSNFHVSEAAGGEDSASSVSSYSVNNNGRVSLLDGPFALNSTGACWVAVARDNRTVFVTNTGSNTISAVNANNRGRISSRATTRAVAGPLDVALDDRSEYLYVLAGGSDEILTYEVGNRGRLSQIDTDGGLPDRASGLVVR